MHTDIALRKVRTNIEQTSLSVTVRTKSESTLAQVFPCHVAFVYKIKDLFAVVSCELSDVIILPKLIKNHFAGHTFDTPRLRHITV